MSKIACDLPSPPPVAAGRADVLREVALSCPLVEEEAAVLDGALLESGKLPLLALKVEAAASRQSGVLAIILVLAGRGQTAWLRGVLRSVAASRDCAEDRSARARPVADHDAPGALDVVLAVALLVRVEA